MSGLGVAAPVTRRGVLLTGALVAVGLGVGWERSAAGGRNADLASLRRADFDRLTGTAATIRLVDRKDVKVRFAGTGELPGEVADPQVSFTARFTSAEREPLPQGTYVLEHGELGRVELFLVPAPTDAAGGSEYVATFNRPDLSGGPR